MAADIRQTIADVHARVSTAVRKRDALGLVDLFSEDAQLFPPDGRLVRGRDEMLDFALQGFAGGLCDLVSETDNVLVEGDLAVESGLSTSLIEKDTGGVSEIKSRYLMVYERRSDGRWLILRDMWNALT